MDQESYAETKTQTGIKHAATVKPKESHQAGSQFFMSAPSSFEAVCQSKRNFMCWRCRERFDVDEPQKSESQKNESYQTTDIELAVQSLSLYRYCHQCTV